eukprot:2235549-Prymnesium_polylepis.1
MEKSPRYSCGGSRSRDAQQGSSELCRHAASPAGSSSTTCCGRSSASKYAAQPALPTRSAPRWIAPWARGRDRW